jgi:TP901 family phage tail tape measure protein
MDGSAKVTLILELKERLKAGLGKAKAYVNENVKEMKDKLNSLKTSHIQAFQSMESQVPGLGSAVGLLADPYALAAAGVVALGTGYYKAAESAMDWEKKMAHANVTAQLTRGELAKLSDQLRDIGTRNVAPLEEVPDAFNRIISAGLDVNTSLKALEPTLRAAKAGFTDMETTAAAGVGVMNASGEDINKVYDTLFATVNKSNAEFKDIAQYLPKIIPNAKAAGFALGETAGAWAYLSAQGRNAEQSTTGLLNLFKAFSNPNTFQGLKDMGVNVFDAAGKMRPLISIVTDLSKKMSGLSDRKRATLMGGLGVDMEGLGALNTMMQDTGKLNDIIKFTTNSTGQLDEAYKDAATSTDNWNIISNKLKDQFLSIGQTALPIIASVGKEILDTIDYFKNLYQTSIFFRDAMDVLVMVFKGWFHIATAAPRALIHGFERLMDVIGWLKEKIFGSGDGFEKFYLKVRPYLMWIHDLFSKITDIAGKFFSMDFKGAFNDMRHFKMPSLADYRKQTEQDLKAHQPQPVVDAFADKKKTQPKAKTLDNTIEGDSVNKITEGSKKVQNITVNFNKAIVESINATNTPGLKGMSAQDIEKWVSDFILKAIRNLETSYS